MSPRGEGSALGLFGWLAALLHNGHGHYAGALADARQACEHEDVMAYGWALVELIEASARVGRPDEAAAALDRLSERTQASGTDWALPPAQGLREARHHLAQPAQPRAGPPAQPRLAHRAPSTVTGDASISSHGGNLRREGQS
jgi:hypothetical protein